ncbi:hypothetical protein T484DRAFT_1933677 [Baffinella frigidus]|nr:hypothetical protein T484DRAFT_1933677 [Cryptophyta sp. CCMP2293]
MAAIDVPLHEDTARQDAHWERRQIPYTKKMQRSFSSMSLLSDAGTLSETSLSRRLSAETSLRSASGTSPSGCEWEHKDGLVATGPFLFRRLASTCPFPQHLSFSGDLQDPSMPLPSDARTIKKVGFETTDVSKTLTFDDHVYRAEPVMRLRLKRSTKAFDLGAMLHEADTLELQFLPRQALKIKRNNACLNLFRATSFPKN